MNEVPTEPSQSPKPVDAPADDVATPPIDTAAAALAEAEKRAIAAEQRINDLTAEMAQMKDNQLRALAEAENVRRRAMRERDDASKFAVSAFAKELLQVADNLRRALETVPQEARETDDYVKNLATGVEMTERQLIAAFEKVGVRRLEALGEPFDPNFHQVVFEVANSGKPGGTVVQVLQAGYTLHGRLLREAMVGVAKGDEAPVQGVDTVA